MGVEIERKFLLKDDSWKTGAGTRYRQGYLNSTKERTVRVRTIDDRGFLTIKGISVGATRLEFEYEIPAAEANQMLDELCEKPLIDKHRHEVKVGSHTFEVDEFHAENEGLVMAEVELGREDEAFERPPWLGEEVTGDPRYFNSNLIKEPYSAWKDA